MLFGNLNTQVDITINGVNIDRVRVTINFLGCYPVIDEKLNWKDHIANAKSKLSKSTAILYEKLNWKYHIANVKSKFSKSTAILYEKFNWKDHIANVK